MRMYWITYLANHPETGDARAEKASPGWYRHRVLEAAETEQEIVANLRRRGAVPIDIRVARKRLVALDRVKSDYKQHFLQAIANNMSQGMSAGKAFLAVAEGETGNMRTRMSHGIDVIHRGGSFANALDALGFFDETTRSIIAAGERAGTLRKSVEAAASHYGSWAASLKTAYALITWLVIEFWMSVLSVAGLRFGMLPGIKTDDPQLTPEQRADLATALSWAMHSNEVLLALALLILIAVVFGLSYWFTGTDKDRATIRGLLQKVPRLNAYLDDKALAGAAKALSSLLRGGLGIVPAIKQVAASVTNPTTAEYLTSAQQRINAGDSVAVALQSPVLTRSEQMLLASHADQAQLATLYESVHEGRTVSAQKNMKRFLSLTGAVTLVYNLASLAAWLYILKLQAMQTPTL